MPSLAISPDTFVATSTANAAVASWSGTSWTTPPALTAAGPTITVLSFDATAQTAKLSVDAGSAVGPVVVSDTSAPALTTALEITPFDGLISLAFAQQALAAAGRALTAAQLATLPSKINTASTSARRWCGDRDFTRRAYDECYTPSLDGTVQVRQIPVNSVKRVSGGRTGGLKVTNTDATTNVRATVGFTSTGDQATGLTFTGLALVRTAAGVDVEVDIPYAGNPTIASMAAAVNAVGNGWVATTPGNFGGWPSSELVGGDVALSALGTGADLEIFAEVLTECRLDRRTGLLSTGVGGGVSVYDGPRWGPYRDQDADAWPGKVRVVYDAGFDQIPGPVQDAVVLLIGWLYDNPARDLALSSESVGAGSYVLNTAFEAPDFPKVVKAILAPYRIWRV